MQSPENAYPAHPVVFNQNSKLRVPHWFLSSVTSEGEFVNGFDLKIRLVRNDET